MSGEQQSQIEAVLVMDACNSTELGRRFGDRMLMKVHNAVREVAVAAARRRQAGFVKGTGDGFLMTFSSCRAAASAALDVLDEMRRRRESDPAIPDVGLRFGMDFGETFRDADGDRCGSVVNLAFRVEGTQVASMHETREGLRKEELPRRDRILLTHNAFQELSGDLEFPCRLAGYFDYKGFEGVRIAVYELLCRSASSHA